MQDGNPLRCADTRNHCIRLCHHNKALLASALDSLLCSSQPGSSIDLLFAPCRSPDPAVAGLTGM